MSLFQCENCGCVENTALSLQGFAEIFEDDFDWSYAPERKGKQLCSACGPTEYADGEATSYGDWHGEFPRVFLPKGKFHTNRRGNLEHSETGNEDYMSFSLFPEGTELWECCSCSWVGEEKDKAKNLSPDSEKYSFDVHDHVCPKCSHKEFWRTTDV